jgi:hypothetical protein
VQHKRPSGVDLTSDGKQLPYYGNGCVEIILAAVHLVTQNIWSAYLEVQSAISTGFDKGFVRMSNGLEVISHEDGTDTSVRILGVFIRFCIQAEQGFYIQGYSKPSN